MSQWNDSHASSKTRISQEHLERIHGEDQNESNAAVIIIFLSVRKMIKINAFQKQSLMHFSND